jgi:sugar (pentulose or hexulose) kinase
LSIVAGVDFGTLSVRVSLFSKGEGRLGSGVAEYPLRRSAQDPNLATQSHFAQMDALERAMLRNISAGSASGGNVRCALSALLRDIFLAGKPRLRASTPGAHSSAIAPDRSRCAALEIA